MTTSVLKTKSIKNTLKRFKRTLSIRIKHNIRIFCAIWVLRHIIFITSQPTKKKKNRASAFFLIAAWLSTRSHIFCFVCCCWLFCFFDAKKEGVTHRLFYLCTQDLVNQCPGITLFQYHASLVVRTQYQSCHISTTQIYIWYELVGNSASEDLYPVWVLCFTIESRMGGWGGAGMRGRRVWGSGDSAVVRAPDSWLKGRGFESLQVRWKKFFSRVDFLCWLLFPYPFHPRVTAVARKRSLSFCQSAGGRLQLNTHSPYVCGFAWSDMVHGCMVYTELAPRRQQFHVAPAMPPALKYTTSVDIQKTRYEKLVTHVESNASAVSLLKRAENSAI